MPELSAVAIFCDDIRLEKSGQLTIVGALGDNIRIPQIPAMKPKLGMYVRVHLPLDFEPTCLKVIVHELDGEVQTLLDFPEDMVREHIGKTIVQGGKVAGFIGHAIASPFKIDAVGRIWLELKWRDHSQYLGGLNFIVEDDNEGLATTVDA